MYVSVAKIRRKCAVEIKLKGLMEVLVAACERLCRPSSNCIRSLQKKKCTGPCFDRRGGYYPPVYCGFKPQSCSVLQIQTIIFSMYCQYFFAKNFYYFVLTVHNSRGMIRFERW